MYSLGRLDANKLQFWRQIHISFVEKDFDWTHPKETCHEDHRETRKKKKKSKAMKFLIMLIVFINRHAVELFL